MTLAHGGLTDQLNPESLSLGRYIVNQIGTERPDDLLPPGRLPDFIKIRQD